MAIAVEVDVTNKGSRAGDEVIQIYARRPGSKVVHPRQQLVGFRRVTQQPNETKTVEISVLASRLAYWDTSFRPSRWKPNQSA
jgi:beta-glucosidase